MNRRPSDRVLRKWLASGKPERIGRRVAGEPELAERLDEMTELAEEESRAIEALVTPAPGFVPRTSARVNRRVDGYSVAGAVLDLLGLGFHVGRALLPRDDPPPPDQPSG